VTANEVDALTAPAGDGAVSDGEFVEAAALDGVMIAFGADVADVEMIKRDAFYRIRSLTSVVEVDAVRALVADFQVAESETVASGELEGSSIAFKMRRLLGIESFQREVVDASDVMTAWVFARSEFQNGAGFEVSKRRVERSRIADFLGRCLGADDQTEAEEDVTHEPINAPHS